MRSSIHCTVAYALLATPCFAQTFNLTDSNMVYDQRPHTALINANADITSSSCAADNTWSMAWVYSISGSGVGTIIDDMNHGSYSGIAGGPATNIQTITDADGNLGVDFVIVETAVSTGPDSGHIDHMFNITNNTSAQLDMTLYRYFDFDIGGDFDDDIVTPISGVVGSDVRIQVEDDMSCNCGEFYGIGADAFEVDVYNGTTASVPITGGPLANTGLPFGPADFTGVVSWTVSLAPGASEAIQAFTGINDVFAGAAATSSSIGMPVGTAGGMTLASDPATLGGFLNYSISNAPASAPTATLLLSFNAAPPVVPVFGLNVMAGAIAANATVALSGGTGTFTVPIGCDPMLANVPIAAQVFAPDATSPATLPLGNSNVLILTIGD